MTNKISLCKYLRKLITAMLVTETHLTNESVLPESL
jgi:hypothetical protein